MSEARPFDIPKRLVWDAYQRVKANRGAAGVDGVSLAAFETDLKNNLYKVWNRMASGSYHPPPVRLVEIPKATGGTRPLGIPTVADRVAQTVVTMVLTRIVYCKDDDRPGQHEHIAFDLHDFLPHELTCSCSCRVNSLYDIAQIPPVFDYFMAAGGCPACAAWPQTGRRCSTVVRIS